MSDQMLNEHHEMRFSGSMELLITLNILHNLFWIKRSQVHGSGICFSTLASKIIELDFTGLPDLRISGGSRVSSYFPS